MAKVRHKQTTLDLALEICGSIEDAFALCEANGWNITDELPTGAEVRETEPTTANGRDIVAQYKGRQTHPASDVAEDTLPGGINYMGIEIDFIVS
jgi:hypothetical protein